MVRRTEKSLTPAGIQTTGHPACSLVTTPTTQSQLPQPVEGLDIKHRNEAQILKGLRFSSTPMPRIALQRTEYNTSGQRLSSVNKQADFGDGNSLQPNEQVQL